MNRETLYRAIGDIDDDLILAASEAGGQKRKQPMLYRMAGLAACLCLIFGGLFWLSQRDNLHINPLSPPTSFKIVVPSGEDTELVSMTWQELLSYYGITELPDTFGETLARTDRSFFVLYRDRAGAVLYDTNTLDYASADGSKTLSIQLSKAGTLFSVPHEDAKMSQIDGLSVLLALSPQPAGPTTYWAELEWNGLSVRLLSGGLEEDEFISVIREFIQILN